MKAEAVETTDVPETTEAPETTESADPSGTALASTPGGGTLAGASMAASGTVVPSGRDEAAALSEAVALEFTRLAVHTPDNSARGTSVIALLRRDSALVVICDSLPWSNRSCWLPRVAARFLFSLSVCLRISVDRVICACC